MQFIDLSVAIEHNNQEELEPAKIKYLDHKHCASLLALGSLVTTKSHFKTFLNFLRSFFANKLISHRDFPGQESLVWEKLKLHTHVGTHMDAPRHYGSFTGASSAHTARTIEQIPLEWCYGDGVVIDARESLNDGGIVTLELVKDFLRRISYSIKAGDIILIQTGVRGKYSGRDYYLQSPGIGAEVVTWLVNQGVKVIGTDGWGFDRPFHKMAQIYFKEKDSSHLWPAHLAGRQKEYCQIEKLTNLDKLPNAFGFKVCCFPIKIKNASAGWVRVVGIIE